MNKDFYYQVGKLTLQVSIPSEISIDNLRTHIPEIKKIEKTREINMFISFMRNMHHSISFNKKSVFICGDWNKTTELDFPHLFYGILRQYWIENELYPVHSVCFENSLIIGHSGTGKTSLAMEALNKDVKVFSFDKTIVSFDNNELVAELGTDIISKRNNDNEREILDYSKQNEKEKINQIYTFAIKNKDLKVAEIDSGAVVHQLYPYFLDVTKLDVLFNDGSGIFNGNTSIESKLKLFGKIKSWVSVNRPVKFISGRYSDIVDYIKANNE